MAASVKSAVQSARNNMIGTVASVLVVVKFAMNNMTGICAKGNVSDAVKLLRNNTN